MKTLLLLMWEFCKTGLFSFGGGLATIPFLKEMAVNYKWFSLDFLSTMIAISQSTPGTMGINMATYVGYTTAGVVGGILATLALVFPSLVITVLISKVIEKFKNSKAVEDVFSGLRPAAVGLIVGAVIDIFISALGSDTTVINYVNTAIYVVMCGIYYKFNKLNPIILIVLGAIVGIVLSL